MCFFLVIFFGGSIDSQKRTSPRFSFGFLVPPGAPEQPASDSSPHPKAMRQANLGGLEGVVYDTSSQGMINMSHLGISIESMGMVYFPIFDWFFMVNVGKYTTHCARILWEKSIKIIDSYRLKRAKQVGDICDSFQDSVSRYLIKIQPGFTGKFQLEIRKKIKPFKINSWLVVSTHLKNDMLVKLDHFRYYIVGMNMKKNIWNHHLDRCFYRYSKFEVGDSAPTWVQHQPLPPESKKHTWAFLVIAHIR